MDFKLFVAVFCLASIQVSEAAVVWTPLAGTATIQDCVATGTAITLPTAASAGQTIASYALTSQTPDSTPKKFALDTTTGALTTLTSGTSPFDAATTSSYAVVITATDDTTNPAALTGAMTLTVTVTACSSASFVFPSLAVMLISLISLLMKNNS